jgi:hypothetical protein
MRFSKATNPETIAVLKNSRLLRGIQQLKETITLSACSRTLPDDANARETGDWLYSDEPARQMVEMLEQIIKEHPEKYQSYDLLAQVLDDEARSCSAQTASRKPKRCLQKWPRVQSKVC